MGCQQQFDVSSGRDASYSRDNSSSATAAGITATEGMFARAEKSTTAWTLVSVLKEAAAGHQQQQDPSNSWNFSYSRDTNNNRVAENSRVGNNSRDRRNIKTSVHGHKQQ